MIPKGHLLMASRLTTALMGCRAPSLRPYGLSKFSSARMLSMGMVGRGLGGTRYRLVQPLKHTGEDNNVWLAVDEKDGRAKFVAKGPGGKDDRSKNWPAFQHEVAMQRKFRDEPLIRQMVDYVPESESEHREPLMILELFEETLWDAQQSRRLHTKEIRKIMKVALLALVAVHKKGLVHTNVKLENIMISGFESDEKKQDIDKIVVKLADCGSISPPGTHEISSLVYRSPEVYFNKPWDQNTDIWSWGIALTQLMGSQVLPGIFDFYDYDSPYTPKDADKTAFYRDAVAKNFDLHSVPFYAQDENAKRLLPSTPPTDDEKYAWSARLEDESVFQDDIEFIREVLHPVPEKRKTPQEMLEDGFFEKPL